MTSTKYTIKELQKMIRETEIRCTVCKKILEPILGQAGINVSDKGTQLYVSGICPNHNNEIQIHYSML